MYPAGHLQVAAAGRNSKNQDIRACLGHSPFVSLSTDRLSNVFIQTVLRRPARVCRFLLPSKRAGIDKSED